MSLSHKCKEVGDDCHKDPREGRSPFFDGTRSSSGTSGSTSFGMKASAKKAASTTAITTLVASSYWSRPSECLTTTPIRLTRQVDKKRFAAIAPPSAESPFADAPSSHDKSLVKKQKQSKSNYSRSASSIKRARLDSSMQDAFIVPRTQSFEPVWAATFDNQTKQVLLPHTLILGTHPSIASLDKQEYYGHPMNAFWWIAGDCLGFRRGLGLNKGGKPYQFVAHHVRHGPEDIVQYHEQLKRFVSNGFCLWDVVQSCHRPGSLDQDIRHEVPNDIPNFCRRHPTIQRIVLANGGIGSKLFVKHFGSQMTEDQLLVVVANDDPNSQRALGPFVRRSSLRSNQNKKALLNQSSDETPLDKDVRTITLISALSVSPAAASYSYKEKRDFWERHVYIPGLKLHQELNADGLR